MHHSLTANLTRQVSMTVICILPSDALLPAQLTSKQTTDTVCLCRCRRPVTVWIVCVWRFFFLSETPSPPKSSTQNLWCLAKICGFHWNTTDLSKIYGLKFVWGVWAKFQILLFSIVYTLDLFVSGGGSWLCNMCRIIVQEEVIGPLKSFVTGGGNTNKNTDTNTNTNTNTAGGI